jgi:hypothetical protein
MKDAEIIDKLNIAWTELKRHGMLLGGKMQCIEHLGLGFCDGRDVSASRQPPVAHKASTSVLHYQSLRIVIDCRLIVEQRPCFVPWWPSLAEP